jgi:hypothetical protein
MNNCFTVVIRYLNVRYSLPSGWGKYTLDINDMDEFVKDEKRFLAKKHHIGFFKSFCDKVNTAKKDDIVLTRISVGVAINRFSYWVYDENLCRVVHSKLGKDCLIMRVKNG